MSRKHHAAGIAGEIAEASRLQDTTAAQQATRGYPGSLVATARSLERLLMRRRKLRAALRQIEANIKHERKMLKALASAERGEEKII